MSSLVECGGTIRPQVDFSCSKTKKEGTRRQWSPPPTGDWSSSSVSRCRTQGSPRQSTDLLSSLVLHKWEHRGRGSCPRRGVGRGPINYRLTHLFTCLSMITHIPLLWKPPPNASRTFRNGFTVGIPSLSTDVFLRDVLCLPRVRLHPDSPTREGTEAYVDKILTTLLFISLVTPSSITRVKVSTHPTLVRLPQSKTLSFLRS